MSEQGGGGRYQRSAGGLVGAMGLTVLAVIGFVLFRGLFSADIDETRPPAIDYLDSVGALQASGFDVVYPSEPPAGWIVTRVDVDPVERPGAEPDIGLDLFTDSDRYAGLLVADADPDDLLAEYLDDSATETDGLPAALDDPAPGGGAWQGWAADDGDHAFTAPFGGRTLMVFGAVDPDALAELAVRLTDAPVAEDAGTPATGAPSPS